MTEHDKKKALEEMDWNGHTTAEWLAKHEETIRAALTNHTATLNPDMPPDDIRLHMGELTPDEVKIARSAIRWANSVMQVTKNAENVTCGGLSNGCDLSQRTWVLVRALEHYQAVDDGAANFLNGFADKPKIDERSVARKALRVWEGVA